MQVTEQRRVPGGHWLLVLVLAYGAASLVHHVHNAILLDRYPNMPVFLSAAGVYAAWICVAAIGGAGYLAYRRRHRAAGLILLGVYGALGLNGLAHYRLAPPAAHTWPMNLTIGLEVATAIVLLTAIARLALKRA
jgi:hypothetical protein